MHKYQTQRRCQSCGSMFWIYWTTLRRANSPYTGLYCKSCAATQGWSSKRKKREEPRPCRLCGGKLPANHRLICKECQTRGER